MLFSARRTASGEPRTVTAVPRIARDCTPVRSLSSFTAAPRYPMMDPSLFSGTSIHRHLPFGRAGSRGASNRSTCAASRGGTSGGSAYVSLPSALSTSWPPWRKAAMTLAPSTGTSTKELATTHAATLCTVDCSATSPNPLAFTSPYLARRSNTGSLDLRARMIKCSSACGWLRRPSLRAGLAAFARYPCIRASRLVPAASASAHSCALWTTNSDGSPEPPRTSLTIRCLVVADNCFRATRASAFSVLLMN
mmetsp:Transcript_52933/g.146683  ORF Transcript_52933/g.146683 Transcript_52933/m.146683 type:complete len:251 (+) Transcript_52933:810-1562(+)